MPLDRKTTESMVAAVSRRLKSVALFIRKLRIALKARMMRIFTSIAVLDFKTLLKTAKPFTVKAFDNLREHPQIDITLCDIKFENSFCESWI